MRGEWKKGQGTRGENEVRCIGTKIVSGKNRQGERI